MKEVTQQEYYTFLERYLGKILPAPTESNGVCWQQVSDNRMIAEKQHRNGSPVYAIKRNG